MSAPPGPSREDLEHKSFSLSLLTPSFLRSLCKPAEDDAKVSAKVCHEVIPRCTGITFRIQNDVCHRVSRWLSWLCTLVTADHTLF